MSTVAQHKAKKYDERTLKIRALNDAHRTSLPLGRFGLAPGAQWLMNDRAALLKFLKVVAEFSDFTEGNDPHGEHDMAFFEFDGDRYFFKFDYYDVTLNYLSEDPTDPKVTTRILTIGEASDY